jgi:hypothetical protein
MDTIPNIPKKIFKFFTQTAEELGKETRFKKRQSKLTPKAFITALIHTCFSRQFELELFRSALKKQNVHVKKQSLFERFNERTVVFLTSLASEALKYFKVERLPQLGLLEQFTAVNIIDSSSISLNSALSKLFKGSGGAASNAAVKIQTKFDYLNGQIKELALTSGCDNDQSFDSFLNSIEKGALYLMDLGYFKLVSFRKIIDGGAFFVSRVLTGTTLMTEKNHKPIDLIKILLTAPSKFSMNLLMGARAKISVRLVAQCLPENLAEQRRRHLKKGHKRRGITPSKELLFLQGWSIYVTNTCEAQISNEAIHTTYACRWQIELFFKLSKSLMQIDSFKTTKSCRVIIEIYGKFICMMLLFLLCAPVRYQKDKELSFYKACKLLIENASAFINALQSIYRLTRFIATFHEDLSLFAIKDIKKRPVLSSLGTCENVF